jgi:hypothetical protein
MLSEATYVDKRQLVHCRAGEVVRVLSIPAGVGVLSDINVSKGVYVALDFVGVSQFLYSVKNPSADPVFFVFAIIERPLTPGGRIGEKAVSRVRAINALIESIKIDG